MAALGIPLPAIASTFQLTERQVALRLHQYQALASNFGEYPLPIFWRWYVKHHQYPQGRTPHV